jgi:hypothetical protein
MWYKLLEQQGSYSRLNSTEALCQMSYPFTIRHSRYAE